MQVELKVSFSNMDEAIAFMAARATPEKAEPQKAANAEAPKSTKPAATQPTAPAGAAQEAKTTAPAAPALPTYEKSGIPEKIAAAVSPAGGKRAAVIALLGKFGAKKGGEIKPADFAAFSLEIDNLMLA
jgi:hypothetical protein